jgi:hypothetical protein
MKWMPLARAWEQRSLAGLVALLGAERMNCFRGVTGSPRRGGEGRVGRFTSPARSVFRGDFPHRRLQDGKGELFIRASCISSADRYVSSSGGWK